MIQQHKIHYLRRVFFYSTLFFIAPLLAVNPDKIRLYGNLGTGSSYISLTQSGTDSHLETLDLNKVPNPSFELSLGGALKLWSFEVGLSSPKKNTKATDLSSHAEDLEEKFSKNFYHATAFYHHEISPLYDWMVGMGLGVVSAKRTSNFLLSELTLTEADNVYENTTYLWLPSEEVGVNLRFSTGVKINLANRWDMRVLFSHQMKANKYFKHYSTLNISAMYYFI